MKLPIQRGPVKRPQRVVIYAPEGLGKSTLASQLASPLFLDFERGTHHLDVARLEPSTLPEVESALAELSKDTQGFETLVVDTIDWLEELVIQDVCRGHKKSGIEDFGYGQGYTVAAERFDGLLRVLDRVAAKMHVVCLAHAHVKRLELPDAVPYDRYTLRLSKQVCPLAKEWADAVLFGNWKQTIKQGDGPVGKATSGSGKQRILRCLHSSIADAKNRHGLNEEEPWGIETLRRILNPLSGESAPARPTPVAPPKEQPAKPYFMDPAPVAAPRLTSEAMEVLRAACEPHEEDVNRFIRARSQVGPEQTWRDLPQAYALRIVKDPTKFLQFVNPNPGGEP